MSTKGRESLVYIPYLFDLGQYILSMTLFSYLYDTVNCANAFRTFVRFTSNICKKTSIIFSKERLLPKMMLLLLIQYTCHYTKGDYSTSV
jgi:hypothetical protein